MMFLTEDEDLIG